MNRPVVINKKLCSGCTLCVEVCPYKAIIMEGGLACYILDDCFSCGHCQAVCPEEAITVAQLELPTVGFTQSGADEHGAFSRETEALIKIMRRRRSCRNFSKREVPLELLEDLIQVGITAPSGTNCQPWKFLILPGCADVFSLGILVGKFFRKLNRIARSKSLRLLSQFFGRGSLQNYYKNHYESVQEALRKWDEDGEDRLFHGATAAILVLAEKDASCPKEDALLATQNILLAAHSIGLGTCLIGFAVEAVARDKSIQQALQIPGNQELHSVIALGYPKFRYMREAGRRKVEPRIFRFDKDVQN